MMATSPYTPLDVTCPECGAAPGTRCRSQVITGRPVLRRPHAARVTAARTAETSRAAPRAPAWASDAWTCPDCGRSYWPPREWEPELWPAVRRAAQELHHVRHAPESDTAGHPGVCICSGPATGLGHSRWCPACPS